MGIMIKIESIAVISDGGSDMAFAFKASVLRAHVGEGARSFLGFLRFQNLMWVGE